MRVGPLGLCAALAFAGAASAGQPISTSLVECSAIFANVARSMANKGKPAADITRAEKGAAVFLNEALAQAVREGVADPGAHIVTLRAEMAEKWDNRFADLAKFTENMDWIDYCAALGESRNILPTTD